MRLITLGVGAADSARYRPAGLLVAQGGVRAMLDGGPGAEPAGRLDAWLVTDERAELRSQLRRLAAERGLRPHAGSLQQSELRIDARPVVHTSHPSFGYLIGALEGTVVWAPEFFEFPRHRVGRLVFAHIGRPTIRAIDRGERPPFGAFARDSQVFRVTGRR
jgi:hypothetical protein